MAGWDQIEQIRRLEQRADSLGMKFAPYKYANDTVGNYACLVPKDDEVLPIYNREAMLFTGTLENAESWMQGVMWARNYDRMVVDKNIEQKREKKESILRQQNLLEMIKNSGNKK
jgi:hypothetical protein